MPIRIEHQPSPAVVGMAGYYAGYAGRKKREQEQQQKYLMDLYNDRQNMLARQQQQFMGFKYQEELNRQHGLDADVRIRRQHDWDVAAAGAERNWRAAEEEKERKWRTEGEKSKEDFEREMEAYGKLD